jgi:molybdopterin-guanine dinucleotide biosynthesis protein
MVTYSNLLLIGGSKQNVGKTTLTIDLLKSLTSKHKIIAIKTSCHFHGILETDIVISKNNKFVIVEETVTNTGKDSARMLEAGASRVFFIQAKDKFIKEAFDQIIKVIDNNEMIICETASLREYLIPEIFIALVNDKNEELPKNKSILEKANLTIDGYLNKKNNLGSIIEIHNNKWKLIQT